MKAESPDFAFYTDIRTGDVHWHGISFSLEQPCKRIRNAFRCGFACLADFQIGYPERAGDSG